VSLRTPSGRRARASRAVQGLPDAEPAFLTGAPSVEPARESEISDLLVIGSRGYGSEGVVVLGEVGDEVLRTAACPALILQGAVETALGDLFGACGKVLIDSAA